MHWKRYRPKPTTILKSKPGCGNRRHVPAEDRGKGLPTKSRNIVDGVACSGGAQTAADSAMSWITVCSACPHAFAAHRWSCHFVLPGIHRSNLGSYGQQLGPRWSEQVEFAKDSFRTSDLRSRGGEETTTQEKVTRHRRGRCHFSSKNETAQDYDSQVFSSLRSSQPGF